MSSAAHQPPNQPNDAAAPQGSTVRRHHTITAASRTARNQAKDIISEETSPSEQAHWNDDEIVDQDWVGGVGAVGEKTSLHRQSSLPTRYHRGFHGSSAANAAPKTAINSLAAIAGHEGDEEPWNIANEYHVQDDEHQNVEPSQFIDTGATLMEVYKATGPVRQPSPPPAGSGVRRHVSLTYGAAVGGPRKVNSGLKRSGTLQATVPNHSQSSNAPEPTDYHQDASEYAYEPEDSNVNQSSGYTLEEEAYLRQQAQQQQQQQQQYGGMNRSWNQNSDWRGSGNAQATTIDDVQRALSTLDIAQGGYGGGNQYASNQSAQPPRFSTSRGSNNGNGGNLMGGNGNKAPGEYEGRRTPNRSQNNWQQQQQQQQRNDWDQGTQQGYLGGRRSNSNLQYSYQQGGHSKGSSGSPGMNNVPAVPAIPQQYLQQQQGQQGYGQQQSGRPGLGLATNFSSGNGNGGNASPGQTPVQQTINTPIDVPSLIAAKGYNPSNFDTKPVFARYFVIKSYTEDDVQKSLKYEIWSSTEPGNKRLDKAFKDTGGRGPIYLFFSVNASGHFCGMAEMLTPVDYTRSSTVWASDKWKGVFKVRWIYVRDIPNSNLRHIKLNNTQERKPVTNSRDTQELLPDAGQEMLRIFHTHPARTSLLQDFAFYELQAAQKAQGTNPPPPTIPTIPILPNSGANSPPSQTSSTIHSPQANHAAIPSSASSTSSHHSNNSFSSNSNQAYHHNSGYGANPMLMGMGMGGMGGMGITAPNSMGMGMGPMNAIGMGGLAVGMGGMGGGHFNTHQAVMRHSSPAPPQGQQGGQGQDHRQPYAF